jgi:hypothetical protein
MYDFNPRVENAYVSPHLEFINIRYYACPHNFNPWLKRLHGKISTPVVISTQG